MNKKKWIALAALGLASLTGGAAFADSGNAPPPTGAILDLGGGETGTAAVPTNAIITSGGTIIPGDSPSLASVDFAASLGMTDITLAMRDDPAGVIVWDVALTDLTHPSGNLLTNGDFSSGLSSWTLLNPYNTSSVINAHTGCGSIPGLSTTCIAAGNDSAYDTIDQKATTTIGDTYQLSFYYAASIGSSGLGAGTGYYNDLSTNGTGGGGGNAIDILAYAQAGVPAACTQTTVCVNPVPLPPNFGLLALGLSFLLWPAVMGARGRGASVAQF